MARRILSIEPSQCATQSIRATEMEAQCSGVVLAEMVDQGKAGYTFELHLMNGRSIVVTYETSDAGEALVGIYKTKEWREDGEGMLASIEIKPSKITYEEYKS